MVLRVVRVLQLISNQSNWLCHLQRFTVAINLKLNRDFYFLFNSVRINCFIQIARMTIFTKLQLMIDEKKNNPNDYLYQSLIINGCCEHTYNIFF